MILCSSQYNRYFFGKFQKIITIVINTTMANLLLLLPLLALSVLLLAIKYRKIKQSRNSFLARVRN